MRVIDFNFMSLFEHGTTFKEYLMLRKSFFVDNLNWDIPHNEQVEFDQYDTPNAHYVAVIKNDRVVAGARLMPLHSRWGDNTSMLLDASQGRLTGLPNNLISDCLKAGILWEGTRLVISDEIQTKNERSQCLHLIITKLLAIIEQKGGTALITLSPISLGRYIRTLGFLAQKSNVNYRCLEDKRLYTVFKLQAAREDEIQVIAA